MIGTKLGPYEITAKLGEGGMGEVYRATDTKLKRDVAIKVLPAAFVENRERLQRFEREAQLLAQLNHSNIAQIYGMEASGDAHALVMELVEGPTLAERLESGPLPFNESLSLARQIAEALEEAHEKGIIHRDLKPQNIKASTEGKIKVLDFGLAKAMDPLGAASGPGSASQLAASPTLTLGATQMGVVLGTAAYMSPEQAKGFPVDKRADIWAFGVVLYEMLTGRRLFEGDSVPETLAGVLKTEIDLNRLPPDTPARVRRMIERCLVRDRRQRLHDIGDARLELEDATATAPDVDAPHAPSPRRSQVILPVVLAALLGIAAGAGLWRSLGSAAGGAPAASPIRVSIVPPPGQQLLDAGISPDGATLALLLRPRDDRQARGALYLRPLTSFDPKPVAESAGATSYGYSPDSRWLYFVAPIAAGAPQRRLARVPVDGSAAPVTVRRWDDAWQTWTVLASGDLLAITGGGVQFVRLPASGEEPGPPRAFEGDAAGAYFGLTAARLPDGSPVLRMLHYGARGYQDAVAALDPESGRVRLLVDDAFPGVPVGASQLLFGRGSALLAAPFDAKRLAVTDAPRSVLSGVRTFAIGEPYPRFELASNGTLLFVPGARLGGGRRLVTVDAHGTVAPWSSDVRPLTPEVFVSASGRLAVAAMTPDGLLFEVWVADRESPTLRRLVTTTAVDNSSPALSRDGTRLAFRRIGGSPQDGLYVRSVDGAGGEKRLAKILPELDLLPLDWSPDGSRLLAARRLNGDSDIVTFDPASGETTEPQPLLATRFNEWDARFSPDGKSLAYVSNESGRVEVYLAPISAGGAVGNAIAISAGPGTQPRWRPDGRAVYFWDGQDRVLSVPVTTSPRIAAGEPQVVVDLEKLHLAEGFDVLPDGRLLFVAKGEEETPIERLDLVLNFTAELRRGGAAP